MRVLDLFCGAGGAAWGIHLACKAAGIRHEIVGVDIKNQPRYPFCFRLANAMHYPLEGFDAVWASPICQKHTQLNYLHRERQYEDYIGPLRVKLKANGLPWIMENVPNSPLDRGSLKLCGTMFGLATTAGDGELRRHRIFECSFSIPLVQQCQHARRTVRIFGTHGGLHTLDQRERRVVRVHGSSGGTARGIKMFGVAQWKEAMGIDWMIGAELSQAIPPAYSEFIFKQFLSQRAA